MHFLDCFVWFAALTYSFTFTRTQDISPLPNIVIIVADDLGWNDVSFHGADQIPTPNIDALAYGGLILNNYYVTAICSPSRSALMTGKHPIHTGMQHSTVFGAEPRGLPLTEKLFPEYLRELGYVNRIVGKWHLGSYRRKYTPLYRGFDSHLGFWTGHQDYFDHTAVESPYWGLDMRRGMDPAWDLHGQYSTDVFTDESVKIIENHNTSRPLFLYLAHAAVHSSNPYTPLPAPDEVVEKYAYINDYKRRRFAAILDRLDYSVGAVTEALNNTGMLENSIIIFTTDNGGPANGFDINYASNWPLRGVKNTLWEGGVRGAACIWSPLLENRQRVSNQFMHIMDWLPTLYSAIGGDVQDLGPIDGIDMWRALSLDEESNRTELLHNIDDIIGNAALTVGDWKLVKNTSYEGSWDDWYGPSGRSEGEYNVTAVLTSPVAISLEAIGFPITANITALRSEADVSCNTVPDPVPCNPLEANCLFNIRQDPCEQNNLADEFPDIVSQLEKILEDYNATAVPANSVPWNPKGDPSFWDHLWTNWGDGNGTDTDDESIEDNNV